MNASASALTTLEKKGVFRSVKLQIDRLVSNEKDQVAFKPLTPVQAIALKEIEDGFKENQLPYCMELQAQGKQNYMYSSYNLISIWGNKYFICCLKLP